MSESLLARLSAVLTQAKYVADRTFDDNLNKLHDSFQAVGMYHGSANVAQTKKLIEEDLEARTRIAVEAVTQIGLKASPRELRESRAAIEEFTTDWLGKSVDSFQNKLYEHARTLQHSLAQLDLGRARLLNALRAELALVKESGTVAGMSEEYIDPSKLEEIFSLSGGKYDFSRLVRMCEELNLAHRYSCFHSIAFLTRAVIDHVSPVFGCKKFGEVASTYPGSRSFKEIAVKLNEHARKVSDGLLHTQVRRTESLPSSAQVEVRQLLNELLAEVTRVSIDARKD